MYKAGGIHIFIDVEVENGSMPEMYTFARWLQEACELAGSTILDHSMESFDDGANLAYTVCYLLSESHASVHTWPEHNVLTIDFFFCGNAKWKKAVNCITDNLKYRKIKIEKHTRGV